MGLYILPVVVLVVVHFRVDDPRALAGVGIDPARLSVTRSEDRAYQILEAVTVPVKHGKVVVAHRSPLSLVFAVPVVPAADAIGIDQEMIGSVASPLALVGSQVQFVLGIPDSGALTSLEIFEAVIDHAALLEYRFELAMCYAGPVLLPPCLSDHVLGHACLQLL